jgi:hypothetical protein
MTQKQLHPSVIKFKEFVKKYPKISHEVKKGNATWQELYEDWYLLGEDDPRWDSFKETDGSREKVQDEVKEEKKSDFMTQMLDYIKTMDVNQMQAHISSFSQALGAVQGVLSQFQSPSSSSKPTKPTKSEPSHPFSFRKD